MEGAGKSPVVIKSRNRGTLQGYDMSAQCPLTISIENIGVCANEKVYLDHHRQEESFE